MDEHQNLSHTKWEVQISRRIHSQVSEKNTVCGVAEASGEVFRRLALQKERRIEEGHLMPDLVHMMIAIPPKYAVSQVIGYITGKSAIHLARVYGERKRNFVGQHFCRGYFVSTVGQNETEIRDYIRRLEQEDVCLDQLNMWR